MEAAIKCVAIDDEPLALEIIDNFCQRLGNVALKKFTDPKEGLECILNDQPDIVFLDIEMDAMDGITIASPCGLLLYFHDSLFEICTQWL